MRFLIIIITFVLLSSGCGPEYKCVNGALYRLKGEVWVENNTCSRQKTKCLQNYKVKY